MSDIPRKSVETFGFRIFNQATSVLGGILLARFLGPYGKGLFTYVGTVLGVLQTLSAGQSSAISWQYGRLRRPSGMVFNAMLRILAYAGIPLAVIVAIVALSMPGQLPLIAVAAALPFTFFAQSALGFFLADGKVRVANVQAMIASVGFTLLLVPTLIIFHRGLTAVLIVWVASCIAAAMYSVIKLRPYAKHFRDRASDAIKEQAIFGIKVTAVQLMSLLNFRIDVFIILFMLGPKALGVYSIAIGFGELMWQIARPLGLSAYGRITSASKAESADLTAKCVRHTLVMVAAGCVILFLVGPTLITLIYGRPFAGAGIALRFLLPGIMAYSMTPFFSGFFIQQLGKPTLQLRILSLSTVICAVVSVITVRPYGVVGGAVATSLSYIVAFAVSAVIFSRATSLSAREIFALRTDDMRPYRVILTSVWNRVRGQRA